MVQLGYAISSEEHAPNDIVRHAVAAEQAGFPYALISDHYHPWVAGYDHVYVHQVGPEQEGMLRFYEREILPHFQRAARRTHATGRSRPASAPATKPRRAA